MLLLLLLLLLRFGFVLFCFVLFLLVFCERRSRLCCSLACEGNDKKTSVIDCVAEVQFNLQLANPPRNHLWLWIAMWREF